MYRCIGWNKSTKYRGPCHDSSRILTTEARVQCSAVHVGSVVDKVAGTGTGFPVPISIQDSSILIRLCQRNCIVVATDSVAKWCTIMKYWKLTDYREPTFIIGLLLSLRFALLCFLHFLTIRRRWRLVKQRGLEMKRSMTCCSVTAGILVKGF
jgi:hypothetical protein